MHGSAGNVPAAIPADRGPIEIGPSLTPILAVQWRAQPLGASVPIVKKSAPTRNLALPTLTEALKGAHRFLQLNVKTVA